MSIIFYIIIVLGISYCVAFEEGIERDVVARFVCLILLIVLIYNYSLIFEFIKKAVM